MHLQEQNTLDHGKYTGKIIAAVHETHDSNSYLTFIYTAVKFSEIWILRKAKLPTEVVQSPSLEAVQDPTR